MTLLGWLDPSPGALVVDAGCGLGFFLHLLGSLTACRLIGVEFDRQRLQVAAEDRGASRAALVRGDVLRLPMRTAVADGLLLSEVLEHLPDDGPALAEAARVLRPGGVVVISVPHQRYPGLWDPPNALREAAGAGHFGPQESLLSGIWTDHQRLYTPAQLVHAVEAAGLAVTAWQLETRWSMPFAHHLVYEVGRGLAARGVGGGRRWDLWDDARPPSWPLRLAISAITAPDRLNRPAYQHGSAVSLCLRAVRP